MTRRILAQGDYTGACFAYAIANAYVALTGQKPREGKWSRAMSGLPHTIDLFVNNYGTTRYNNDRSLFKGAIQNTLNALGEDLCSFKVDGEICSNGDRPITECMDDDSVILFCPKLEHWTVAVSYQEKPWKLYLACSSALTDSEPGEYWEERAPLHGRSYNDESGIRILRQKEFPFKVTVGAL